MTEEKKKGFLSKAVDALTSRDEKAALETAKQEAEAAKKDAASLRAKMASDKANQAMKDRFARQPAAPATKAPLAKHVWKKDDTYAALAFKHYGSIKEPYWRLIYEHNKDKIGGHPNDVRVGLEIEIPPLPDELKKK